MDLIDLDYASKLHLLPPEELVLELSSLAIAVNFDFERFCKALGLLPDRRSSRMLYDIVLDDTAQLWRETKQADLDEEARIHRWKVITA